MSCKTVQLALLACASGVTAPGPVPFVGAGAVEGPFRELSVEDALEAGRREDKPVLIVLLESDCGPCDAYDRFVFADEAAGAWIDQHLVAVRRVDDAASAARFEVAKAPGLVFVTPDGVELDRIWRFLEPGPFVEAAQAVLDRRSPVGLARQAIEQAPDDAGLRLELARLLLQRGRQRAALESFLWVFDHTRSDPSWQEQRLGEILARLATLQRSVPEAGVALRERRDRAAAALLAQEPGPEPAELEQDARDLAALNQALTEIRATLEVWDALRGRPHASGPVLAALLDTTTQLLLLEDGRFEDLLDGLGDPLLALQTELGELKSAEAQLGPRKVDRVVHDRLRARALASAGRYFHALLGAGREEDAAALVELLLGLEPGYGSYESLISSAVEVERLDLARALADRGLQALPKGPERQKLRRFSRVVLKEDG